MTRRLPLSTPDSAFRDDEPVVQSHPLLPGAQPPRFGHPDVWDLNDVVERPVNQYPANYRVQFGGLSAAWNLRAREMAMIWLNPRHPAVLAAGVHLRPEPREPRTVVLRTGTLRALASWAAGRGLSEEVTKWDREELHRYLTTLTGRLALGSVNDHVVVIKALHRFGPLLAGGGLAADPWPGRPARQILGIRDPEQLATPAIPPQTWFALIRAAWIYIDAFGPDILRARATWRRLQAAAHPITTNTDGVITAWLADPQHLVPVRPPANHGQARDVHWAVLSRMIGASNDLFGNGPVGRRRRAEVVQVAAGGRTQSGLITGLHQVTRPDGTSGPWHPALHPREMWLECVALRNACYILTAALSMMRDSEIRAVTHGSLVQHYGAPAVASTKRKHDPTLPTRHWWVIEPVEKAIHTASQLSLHPDLAFARVRDGNFDELFGSASAIESFIRHVNAHRDHTGLSAIPAGRVTPHMFRRTMAMLTRDHPGAEIALGMQLKHAATRALANRSTQGYSATAPAWAGYFDDALATARFHHLRDLYDTHRSGQTIGYGPAADRLRGTFDTVTRTAQQTGRGDARLEYDLLRQAGIAIRFGRLNHCTLDDTDPAGAKCLENTVVPPGHTGPLIDRCQPTRCANSLIATEHLPLWRTEEHTLLTLLDTPKIATGRRAQLQQELHDVRAVISRATQ